MSLHVECIFKKYMSYRFTFLLYHFTILSCLVDNFKKAGGNKLNNYICRVVLSIQTTLRKLLKHQEILYLCLYKS